MGNETWIIETGDAVIQKMGRSDTRNLAPLETLIYYGGPHCLDQKTDLIREPGDSQSPALSFWGSGSAQVSAANRSGATAPKRRPSLLLVYGRAIGPFTVTFPWYTSHGVSYAKLW